MAKQHINVFIVDDSPVSREMLSHILKTDPEFKVSGSAESGEQALKMLPSLPVDVVTMDLHLPGINGFEVTRRIMETKPIPIVVISSLVHTEETAAAFRAMEAGALAVLEKPGSVADEDYKHQAEKIKSTIKMISEVKLIKRKSSSTIQPPLKPTLKLDKYEKMAVDAIAIGASLGGPVVLATILSKLTPNFPVPIYIVQHISPGFVNGLIDWLQTFTSMKLEIAKDGSQGLPGHCYFAPDGFQMEIQKSGRISLMTNHQTQPSVSRLFKSIGETFNKRAIAVLLTGMGKDGAQELLHLRRLGACTIAQDEKSSVVYGMPGEASAIGAVQYSAPPEEIAAILNHLVSDKE